MIRSYRFLSNSSTTTTTLNSSTPKPAPSTASKGLVNTTVRTSRLPRSITRTDSINSGSYSKTGPSFVQSDISSNSNSAAAATTTIIQGNENLKSPLIFGDKTSPNGNQESKRIARSLVDANVHGSYSAKHDRDRWLKQPLFKRGGVETKFASGRDAANLLVKEATRRDPYQLDYLELVREMSSHCTTLFEVQPQQAWVFKQLMEPEQFITFRVPWTDDDGNRRINRGYRVQYSRILGPYHGGIRFHPQMSHGVCRMLGLEQTMKNAISGFAVGGAFGGSDFDPTDKSPLEIKHFCEKFMEHLAPFIGPEIDTLDFAGGVNEVELSVLAEKFNLLQSTKKQDSPADISPLSYNNYEHHHSSSKGSIIGNALVFPESTGHGVVHFAERAMSLHSGSSLKGKRCAISGSNMHAMSIAEKLLDLGAIPVVLSDLTGYLYEPNGFDQSAIQQIAFVKKERGYLEDYTLGSATTKFSNYKSGSMWENVQADVVFLTVANGELSSDDAEALVNGKTIAVFEGIDRACSETALKVLRERNILIGPSKACMAGACVANSLPPRISKAEFDSALKARMYEIHDEILDAALHSGNKGNLSAGAHVFGFLKIANSGWMDPQKSTRY